MSIEEIITGEKFQTLAKVSISKEEHKKFEYKNYPKDINIDRELVGADNPELVYINSSLFNLYKPKLVSHDIYNVLKTFKNPFRLILHNSDQNIGQKEIDKIKETKCTKVYTQNLAVKTSFAIPLPIGIANSCWEWGNLQTLTEVIKQEIPKNKEVYYYFTSKGGERDIHRQPCTDICTQLTIPIQPKQKFKDYLINLKQHKFSICPSGNGLDTYRLWESLYLRTIPICIKTPFIDFFSKYFPMIVLEKWEDLNLINLEEKISVPNWDNYHLLSFNNYCKHVNLV